VSDHELERINSAVRECLARCYAQGNPLVAMAEYFEELRASGQWKDNEIALVRARVSRLLRQLGGDADGGDSGGGDSDGGEYSPDLGT
jgi:hypothetical protein